MALLQNRKRLGIFAFYDAKGIVDDYVFYILDEIKNVLDSLIIVCGKTLTQEGRQKLERYGQQVLCIEAGHAPEAWKAAVLNSAASGEIFGYDELVLLNDKFYGPFYSFETIFAYMDKREADFWGLSACQEMPDESGVWDNGYAPEHIWQNFIVFRKRMMSDPVFFEYWEKLKSQGIYSMAGCTRFFAERGFFWDVYIHLDEYRQKRENGICCQIYLPYDMVRKMKMPVLDRESLTIPYEDTIHFSGGESLARCLEYIENGTSYDTRLIWKHLLRICSLSDLKQCLHLNYVLPNGYLQKADRQKTEAAVIIHSYYPDLINDIVSYARHVPEEIDLYITTESESKERIIRERLLEEKLDSHSSVIRVENRGRDLSALLVGCREIVSKYKYVCFTHDKKTLGNCGPAAIGRSYFYTVIENVLSSREYIYNILHTFEKNKNLGILSPPSPLHNIYFGAVGREWTSCYEKTKALFDECGLTVAVSKDKQPFVLGTSFWFRTEALAQLFDMEWTYEDFPNEPLGADATINHALERSFPYFAQEKGYYSAWVMTQEYASLEISNLRFLLSNAVNVQQTRHEPYVEQYFKHYMAVQRMEPYLAGAVYYDTGCGFCESDKENIFYRLNVDGTFICRVNVPLKYQEAVNRVRIDLYEQNPFQNKMKASDLDVMACIKKAVINETGVSVIENITGSGLDMENGYQWFQNKNPCYTIDISKRKLTRSRIRQMTLSGVLTVLRKEDVKHVKAYYRTCQTGLYWDDGSGFCEKHCCRKEIVLRADGKFHLVFDIGVKEQVSGIRFDPLEEAGGLLHIDSMLCNGALVSKYEHNGRRVKGNYIYFETEDPVLVIRRRFRRLDKVEITGTIIILPFLSKKRPFWLKKFFRVKGGRA